MNQNIAGDSLPTLLADDARNQWYYADYYDVFNELTKYYSGDPLNVNQTSLSDNCYAFRLSEAYLLEAEALALSGGDETTAKTLLQTVMSHAGAGPTELAAVDNASTPAALQLEIVKENIQSLNPNITDPTELILPIPYSELYRNEVIQNPGY